MKKIVFAITGAISFALYAFVAATNSNGTVTLTADADMAICTTSDFGPSTITSVVARVGREAQYKDCAYGDPSAVAKYSTLSIKRELAALGKWATVKALLEQSGYWDDYVLANYLAANDPVFVTACAAIVSQGILTQTELDSLLPKCIWTAD